MFFAIDHDTEIVPAWAVGKRTEETALALLYRLKGSPNGTRPQDLTEAWNGYPETIEQVFGSGVDYATLTKEYESVAVGPGRYVPPRDLRAAVSLHFGYYNFVWQPRTLRGLTPAMAAEAVDSPWEVADLVGDC